MSNLLGSVIPFLHPAICYSFHFNIFLSMQRTLFLLITHSTPSKVNKWTHSFSQTLTISDIVLLSPFLKWIICVCGLTLFPKEAIPAPQHSSHGLSGWKE